MVKMRHQARNEYRCVVMPDSQAGNLNVDILKTRISKAGIIQSSNS